MRVDPLAELAHGWTPYRSAFNNPIMYIDPFGLFETRKEARKHKRQNKIRGKIRKNKRTGRFDIRHRKSDGYITRTESGEIEYGATAFSGNAIRPYEPNLFEKIQTGSFLGGMAVGILDDAWITTQRFNPLDRQTTHLNGHLAYRNEYVTAFGNTVATVAPILRATSSARVVMPQGMTIARRLNAAQFSKRFKGTMVARAHPTIRGKLNKLLNKGIDNLNTRVETGNAVISGTKTVGNSNKKE